MDNLKYYNLLFVILLFVKSKYKKVNLTSLDKPNPNYLIYLSPILFSYKYKSKLFSLTSLDKTI